MSASTNGEGAAPGRTRDPERREKILQAAATLVAEHGYHAVSLSDIGAAAGIVGSGIYRHFEGKSAILVEVFDRVIDQLLEDQTVVLESEQDLDTALDRLIAKQVDLVVQDRAIAQVYHREIANLPTPDSRRLRRKQRHYLEGWVHLLQERTSDMDDVTARTLVHAAIGAIQSPLFHNVGLPDERMRHLLVGTAHAVLLNPEGTHAV